MQKKSDAITILGRCESLGFGTFVAFVGVAD